METPSSGDDGEASGEARRREKKEREDEARRRAERRAEKDRSEPPTEERYKDASIPIIPENCIMDAVSWWVDNPSETFPGTFTIIGGQATASYDDTVPERSGDRWHIGPVRNTGEFAGTLKDNTIRGTWTRTQHRHIYSYTSTRADGSSYRCVHERWGQASESVYLELQRDGTFAGISEDIDGLYQQRVIECPETGGWTSMTPDKKKMKFRGTWHIRSK